MEVFEEGREEASARGAESLPFEQLRKPLKCLHLLYCNEKGRYTLSPCRDL